MDKIITISRQFGSGGRYIGRKLAESYGIPFYDNELISRAAKESGFAEAVFENAEKKATNSFLYSIAMGLNTYGAQEMGFMGLSMDDRIFLAQSKVIQQVADEGPCVIVGRCSDYILRGYKNVVNLFIGANVDFRIDRAVNVYGLDKVNAAEKVLKYDKRRANYYNYHAGEKWGNINNYDMAIHSDYCGIERTVDVIRAFLGE